ncbi:MAG: YicC family protein, partial [Gammaproteobacteria bacterium]|nr:YicC family protein [Gammaproteobacteria bacterium]
TWEIRTVNHRYLDVNLRLPEELRMLEAKIREHISNKLKRGKVDCSLRFDANEISREGLSINVELAKSLVQSAESVQSSMDNPAALNAMDVLRWPGVINRDMIDAESISDPLLEQLDLTLERVLETRLGEGQKLQLMILERCESIASLLNVFKEKLPEIQQMLRDRLTQKSQELAIELDKDRLEQEILLLVQKSDVAEELDRLDAHLEEVRQVVQKDEPVGRRLDFLMQELNREANTLGSKAANLDYTNTSVDLKVLIEQMREQIQNIE